MKGLSIVGLFIVYLAVHVEQVKSECCYMTWRDHCDTVSIQIYCDDCSKGDGLYCGYGPCNIFGCNCEGGCRKPLPELSSPGVAEAKVFRRLDKNKNGFLEKDELLRFATKRNITTDKFIEEAKKADLNDDNKISAQEFLQFNHKAKF